VNWLEEQNTGRLLSVFRTRTGRVGADITPLLPRDLFGSWSAPRISMLENNTLGRPEPTLLARFAEIYGVTPWEYTLLLRQSDHPPAAEDVTGMQAEMAALLAGSTAPAYVLDYRSRLLYWNAAFQREFGSRGETSPGVLPLAEGLSLFLVLFSPTGRFRRALPGPEWERLADYFLVRFWRSSLPQIQPHWEPETQGEPAWLRALLADTANALGSAADDFTLRSAQIRQELSSQWSWRDDRTQLLDRWLIDRLVLRAEGGAIEVVPSALADARFTLYQHLSL
jgi:hypothetical protein